jgi:opacity protein-like surface antigen
MRLGFASVSGLLLVGAAQAALAEEAPSLPEPAAATSSAGRLTVGETSLAVGGFLQADGILMDQSSEGQLFPSGGEPLNTQRFLIRRARLSAEAHRGALGAVVELDANTMKGMAVGLARAELALGGTRPRWNWELGLGLLRIPFGLEVQERDPDRFFLERSSVSRALFPGTFDLGARAQIYWRFFRAQLAAMNGNPLGDASFPARDPNAAKDFVGRLGMDSTIAAKVHVSAGVSSLRGTGFHPGTSATKDVLVWRDQNEDGIVQLSEIQVIPGRAATPSQDFSRFAVGADSRVGFAIPRLGNSVLFGEVVWAANLDRALRPADPVASGRDLREFGWVVGAGQEFTSWVAVGVRYDLYNPDVDAYRQTPTVLVPKDVSFHTWTFTVSFGGFARNRLMLEYQHNRNALGVAADGSPTTLAADTLTLRGQMVF